MTQRDELLRLCEQTLKMHDMRRSDGVSDKYIATEVVLARALLPLLTRPEAQGETHLTDPAALHGLNADGTQRDAPKQPQPQAGVVDRMAQALREILQRANESGTGEMGLINTIHDLHRIAHAALQSRPSSEREGFVWVPLGDKSPGRHGTVVVAYKDGSTGVRLARDVIPDDEWVTHWGKPVHPSDIAAATKEGE